MGTGVSQVCLPGCPSPPPPLGGGDTELLGGLSGSASPSHSLPRRRRGEHSSMAACGGALGVQGAARPQEPREPRVWEEPGCQAGHTPGEVCGWGQPPGLGLCLWVAVPGPHVGVSCSPSASARVLTRVCRRARGLWSGHTCARRCALTCACRRAWGLWREQVSVWAAGSPAAEPGTGVRAGPIRVRTGRRVKTTNQTRFSGARHGDGRGFERLPRWVCVRWVLRLPSRARGGA